MGVKKIVKKGLFSGLNPMRWIGYEQIATNAKTIKNIASGLAKPNKNAYQPTSFEDALQHYGLTEADLKKRMKNSFRLSLVCLGLSVLMIIYMVIMFKRHLPLAGIMCVMLTLLLWAYSFREHFNYFQMKQRRLGCTFKEWFSAIVKGKK